VIWNSSLSAKYDRKFSLEAIENRFNNVEKSTYITLADIKKDPDFRDRRIFKSISTMFCCIERKPIGGKTGGYKAV